MYTKGWEIEGLEEKITELENTQENIICELSDMLDLLETHDEENENIFEVIALIKNLMKELR
jgi:hypothetical protein